MPFNIRAFTLPDEQGDYNIYLNSLLTEEQQKLSLAHEQKHIADDDFSKELSAVEIERAMNYSC